MPQQPSILPFLLAAQRQSCLTSPTFKKFKAHNHLTILSFCQWRGSWILLFLQVIHLVTTIWKRRMIAVSFRKFCQWFKFFTPSSYVDCVGARSVQYKGVIVVLWAALGSTSWIRIPVMYCVRSDWLGFTLETFYSPSRQRAGGGVWSTILDDVGTSDRA